MIKAKRFSFSVLSNLIFIKSILIKEEKYTLQNLFFFHSSI
nr:MAG TPA: hypothetical protein [Caudoviricetes sp.]